MTRGTLTGSLLHIWNHGDINTCGAAAMQCPRRNGTTATMGNTD